MDKPISLFRKTFFYSVIIALSVNVIFKLFPLLFTFLDSTVTLSEKNFGLWLTDTLYSMCLSSVFALVLPWIMLSFYGEMFYTRAFNRKEFFDRIMSEYLKWFSSLTIISIVLALIYNYFQLSEYRKLYLRENLSLISIALFLALIMSGNTKTLIKMLKPGVPLILLSTFIRRFSYHGIDIGVNITIFAWFFYLIYCYKIVSKYDEDLDLNVPGRKDDENRAIANLWIFSKEFNSKDIKLKKDKSFIAGIYSSFRLTTEQTKSIYIQLSLIVLGISLFFIVSYTLDFSYFISEDFLASSNTDLMIGNLVIFLGILVINFSNPKYIILPNEEFLLTRALSRRRIYFNNLILQSIFSLIGFILIYSILKLSFQRNNIATFDFKHISLCLLWFFISGEMGILFLISFVVFDVSTMILNPAGGYDLTVSFFINMFTAGFYTFGIWFTALFFRFWDYLYFSNKEIGFFKGIKFTLMNLAKNYLFPLIIFISVYLILLINNPMTKFLNSFPQDSYNYLFNADSIYSSLFTKDNFNEAQLIRNIISEPSNKEYYLDISKNYIDNTFYYKSKPYRESSSLLIGFNYKNDPYSYNYYNINKRNGEYWFNLVDKDYKSEKYYYLKATFSYYKNNYIDFEKYAQLVHNPEYLEEIAFGYEFSYEYEKALRLLKSLIKTNPKHKKMYETAIGRIYKNSNKMNEFFDFYSKINDSSDDYYYTVCSNLISVNIDKINELPLNSYCQQDDIRNKYFKNTRKNIDVEKSNNGTVKRMMAESNAKFYIRKGNLKKAEDNLIRNNTSRGLDYGELALLQIKMDKIKDAEETLKKYNYKQTYIWDFFDYKAYLAQLILGKGDNFINAKKVLLTSPDTENAFGEISKYIDKKSPDFQELKKLKNDYEYIYSYFYKQHNGLLGKVETRKMITLLNKNLQENKGRFDSELNKQGHAEAVAVALNSITRHDKVEYK